MQRFNRRGGRKLHRIIWLIAAALALLIIWFMISLYTPDKDPGFTPPSAQGGTGQ